MMKEEVLINATPRETRVAIVENGIVQELMIERSSHRGIVGNIYKGKVGKLEDFVCGPKKFNLLIDKVSEYVDMSDDEILLRRELEEGQALGDEIVHGLQGEQALDLGVSATNSTQQVFRI